jgi:methanogenic corrinoid protein MtbC1
VHDANHPLPQDVHQRRFLGEFLRQQADEIAARAAKRLCGSCQHFAARWKPMPDLRWKDHLAARVHELAASVEAGCPELFCVQIEWAGHAFLCRGVPVGDLATSLERLWDVMKPELDPEDAAVLERYFERAVACARALCTQGKRADVEVAPRPLVAVEAASAYLRALAEGDRRGACEAVLSAVRRGLDARDAYTMVLGPVQREIGNLWHAGELTIAEEHFASATMQTAMSQLLALAPAAPSRGLTAMVAAVDGNIHDLGARQVADFFEMDGWRTVYLGGSVPTDDLASAAAQFGAHVVGLSAALPVHLRAMEDAVAAVRERAPSAAIIVGGPVFCAVPELWRRLGADGSACDAGGAVELARTLVAAGRG